MRSPHETTRRRDQQRGRARTRTAKRTRPVVIPFVAAGLAATSLSFTAGPASAAATPAGSTAYSGYSTSGVATPVKVEIFEPTIPMPTIPQGEFDFGYAKTKGASTSTKGRASFMWPGDGIGEGLTTFFSQLGLPTQLVQNGYPVQVNSQYPGDTTTQKNSPFPGTSMTTTSGKGETRATVGFSNDCDAADGGGDDSGNSGDGPSGGLLPGLPTLPIVPGLPLIGDLTDNLDDVLGLLGLNAPRSSASAGSPSSSPSSSPSGSGSGSPAAGAASGSSGSSSAGSGTDPADSDECQLPAALSLLVDVNGYVADSHSVSDGSKVTSTSRASLGDVRLLGGIVSMSGIDATVVSSSDGKTGQSVGRADYGTLTIAGQTFAMGPEGVTAPSQAGNIPGLPDDPAAALKELGITIDLPKPVYKADGDKATGTVEAMTVTIDLKTLKPVLSKINLGPILAQVPFPPQAAPLKSLLGAIGNLSPKIVLHLAYTTSAVDTVQPIAIPPADTVPDNDPSGSPSAQPSSGTTGGATAGGGGGGTGTGSGAALPPADTSGGGATGSDTSADAIAPVSSSPGLPPLFSIPGMLLFAGLGGAVLAGSYVRRLGALVLGAGGACPHGLESGLPDLRKVQ